VEWNIFKQEFTKRLDLQDPDYLQIIFATALAHRLPGDPLWLFWVAQSGGGKTEVLRTFRGVSDIKYVESLSEKGLVSFFVSPDDKSLVRLLDNKCLIIKDFTTLFEARPEVRKIIFSQLRGLYDGEYDAHTGVGGKSFKVKFGIVAGVTPVIEEKRTVQVSLGERFLFLKTFPDKDTRKQRIRAAMKYSTMQPKMRNELRELTATMMGETDTNVKIQVGKDQNEWFIRMAELLAQSRAHVPRDPYQHHIIDEPKVELATRLVGQLMRLFMALRVLVDKDDALRATIRVVKDSIPGIRAKMMECALNKGEFKIGGFESKISNATLQRYAKDLEALDIFQRTDPEDGTGRWILSGELVDDVKGLFGGEKELRKQRRGMWE